MKKNFAFLMALAMIVVFAACGSDSELAENGDQENTENVLPTADGTNNGVGALTETSMTDQTGMPITPPAEIQAPPSGPTTTISIVNGMEFDYGTIDAGKKVSHKYKLKNTGSEPLIISGCKGSCGCTVPKCPTEPVAPGETVDIPVEFDSKGKNGPDTKQVTITANTNPSTTILTIKGTVKGQAPATNVN
jgi:hypothetical protein